MHKRISTLAIVSDRHEAEQALKILKDEKDYLIIALWPDAELYISKRLIHWKNPLYKLVGNDGYRSSRYLFRNFKIARKWAAKTAYQYIQDRLGYFLTEFDRSFDFAVKIIGAYKPKKLIIGEPKDFIGSSVIFGTLKTNAFFLIAQEKKIPYIILRAKTKLRPLRQMVGQLIQSLRGLAKQTLPSNCDVLVVATGRQLSQMGTFVKDMGKSGLKVKYLTYNMTFIYKRRLSFLGEYLEKEKLLDEDLKSQTDKMYQTFITKKWWNKFRYKKYENHKLVMSYIREKIRGDSQNEMQSVFSDIVIAKKIFLGLSPKILITLTDPDTKVLPYITTAKKMGIKTVCMQHGAIYPFDSPAIYPVSEYFVVWSKLVKDWILDNQYFRKVKMRVGESPFHKIREITKLQNSKNLNILYLNTAQLVDQAIIIYYLKTLFSQLSQYGNDIKVFLRMHPNQLQYSSNFDFLTTSGNLKVIWSNDEDLGILLKKVNVVVYENTTAGFDAMLAGKPTIYFNPYTGEDFFDIGANGASLPILKEKDMEKTLPDFLNNFITRSKFANNGYKYAIRYLGLKSFKINSNVKVIKNIL